MRRRTRRLRHISEVVNNVSIDLLQRRLHKIEALQAEQDERIDVAWDLLADLALGKQPHR